MIYIEDGRNVKRGEAVNTSREFICNDRENDPPVIWDNIRTWDHQYGSNGAKYEIETSTDEIIPRCIVERCIHNTDR